MLVYQYPLCDQAQERLKVMTETNDGFVIAEKDLELRGFGDLSGTRQSGLPALRLGDLRRDHALMVEAREAAERGWPRPRTPSGSTTSAAPGSSASVWSRSASALALRAAPGPAHRRGRAQGAASGLADLDGPASHLRSAARDAVQCPGTDLSGARVLDGFAGTGAVGIEALSRGAAHVMFVDHDPRALALIRQNLARCGVTGGYTIQRVDLARSGLAAFPTAFDLVFLDPPYETTRRRRVPWWPHRWTPKACS